MRTTEQEGDGVVNWQNTSICIHYTNIHRVVRLKTVKCNIIFISLITILTI